MSVELCQIPSDRIDPDANKVVRRLTRHGYIAYLVGGCVRDLLLGRSPKDFDVSTDATPTEIRKLFRNSRIIGRRFRLAHIFFGRHIIETATFRAEPEPPSGEESEDLLIWRDNAFGTAEEDARRRDFTINGLFYDIRQEQVIDWVGGLEDLRAGLVRTIGDPEIRFQEDPVRMLRAIKFAARLDMQIEEQTYAALIKHRGLVARCSVARVLEEIYRLLGGGHARASFALLQQTGMLPVLFPELSAVLDDPPAAAELPDVSPIRPGRRPAATADVEIDHPAEEVERIAAGIGELLEELELDQPQARKDATAFFWQAVAALDKLAQASEQPIGHALLLAVPTLTLLEAQLWQDQPLGVFIERLEQTIGTFGRRLQISRRDKDRLKHLLIAQRRMSSGRFQRRMTQREHFSEALTLLKLRHSATGQLAEALDKWQEPGGPRRRRRRRGRAQSDDLSG